MLPCVISGRGTVFFYYRQNTVHKGLRNSLPPPSLPSCCVCARALARLARTKLSRLLYKESYIFFISTLFASVYSVIKRGVSYRCNNVLCFMKNNAFVV